MAVAVAVAVAEAVAVAVAVVPAVAIWGCSGGSRVGGSGGRGRAAVGGRSPPGRPGGRQGNQQGWKARREAEHLVVRAVLPAGWRKGSVAQSCRQTHACGS